MDLRERLVDRIGRAVEAEPLRGDEPEHDHDRLVVAQHEGRQAVARTKPVAAPDAPLAFDGQPDRLERRDVPADRPPVDVEPVGDLGPGREWPGLKESSKSSNSRRCAVAARQSTRESGRNRPYLLVSVPDERQGGKR